MGTSNSGPSISGEFGFVYMFFTKLDENPVYVGSTRHIYNRLRNHLITNSGQGISLQQREQVYEVCVSVSSEFVCREIEAYIIDTYKPRFNTLGGHKTSIGKIGFLEADWDIFTKEQFCNDNTVCYGCFDKRLESVLKKQKEYLNGKLNSERQLISETFKFLQERIA